MVNFISVEKSQSEVIHKIVFIIDRVNCNAGWVFDVNTFLSRECVGWTEECGDGEDGEERASVRKVGKETRKKSKITNENITDVCIVYKSNRNAGQ